jgi:hypothetical protein
LVACWQTRGKAVCQVAVWAVFHFVLSTPYAAELNSFIKDRSLHSNFNLHIAEYDWRMSMWLLSRSTPEKEPLHLLLETVGANHDRQ